MKSLHQIRDIFALGALCALSLSAQDRMSIPLKDPGRPATLVVNMLQGTITVKGYEGKEILIEATPLEPSPEQARKEAERRKRPRRDDIPDGMHRVSTGLGGLDGVEAVEENNVVTVRSGGLSGRQALTIQVPGNSAVKLRQTNGRAALDGISGEIDVNTVNGDITISGASAALLAHSTNGKIAASFRQLPMDKPVNLSTMNGSINLSLPADVKAKLVMKTENGDIVTDFDLKLEASVDPPVAGGDGNRGKYQYRVSRRGTVTGTINGGGGNIHITSYNGRVSIGKTK